MSRRAGKQQLPLFAALATATAPARVLPTIEPASGDEETRRAARELRGDLVLRAGAGTGKTHTLVEVTAHMVAGVTSLGRVPVGNILALTFSEKAASELRARVRARFLELAAAPRADRGLEEAYRRAGVVPAPADVWRAAAMAVGGAAFTTFHGFAAGLVRRHGADPGFDILDEDEASALLRARAEEAVLGALDEQPDQVAALVRELDFSRGAGSRARGLVEHVIAVAERLREDGLGAHALDAAGDDPVAARQTLAAAAAAHGAALRDLVAALAGTNSSAGIQARRAELAGLLGAIDEALAGLDGELDPFAAGPLRRVIELTKGSIGNSEARASARKRLRAAETAILGAHVTLRAAPLATAFVDLVARVLDGYGRAKRALGVLDFADLVARGRLLLASDPAARAAEAARHRAVLVDELQDTNELQDQLVGLVRAPGAPLVCVGDPKQSIYEFRGADVSVFARVAERVVAAGGRALALTESRRARAPLTAFVNGLFGRAMVGGPHPFEIAFDPASDALHSHRGGEGVCVELLEEDDSAREAAFVARHVHALVSEGRRVVYGAGRGGEEEPRAARWGDVAILLRRFTHLEAFLEELRRAGVPHYVVNGRGFYEAQEVRDLVHALVLLDDPDHSVATLTVLRSPLVALSDPSLVALATATGGPLRLAPLLAPGYVPPEGVPADQAERLLCFAALFARLRAHADRLGAAGVLRALVEETDLAAVLATTHHGEQRVANLERLLAVVADHDASGRGDRTALVRRLFAQAMRPRSLAAPAQIVAEREDVVRVMTVHQAKGLEFPVVYVPECGAPDRDPGGEVVYDRHGGLGFKLRVASQLDRVASARAERVDEVRRARSRAESLRLFYVATTRARDLLVLSGTTVGQAPTWRREVDTYLDGDPAGRELVRRVAPLPRSAPARLDLPQAVPGPPRALPPSLDRLPGRAQLIVAPVTVVADFAVCPRRYQLRHEVGLTELRLPHTAVETPATEERPDFDLARTIHGPTEYGRRGASSRRSDEGAYSPSVTEERRTDAPQIGGQTTEAHELSGLNAADRGTLAHGLLQNLDFAAWARRGQAAIDDAIALLPPAPPADVADVRARVAAFLEAPFGRELCRREGRGIRREVPFAYAVDAPAGPRLLLKGQMDLVIDDGDEGVTILDYKLARPGNTDTYRLQLVTYAAAARALWNRPARVGIVYLRERVPAPRFLPAGDVAGELGELASALARSRQEGRYHGRPPEMCASLHCGFIARCHSKGLPIETYTAY